jgi:hypothetical protein
VAFHQLLVAARKTWLMDALRDAVSHVDPNALKAQLSAYVPPDAQQILAAAGIRDEHVFPVPVLLEEAPTLVGYYRLLLGLPQKSFYGKGTGMGQVKGMEFDGTLNKNRRAAIPGFCQAMAAALADLVRQLSPTVTPRDVSELPLLTLGSQWQGSRNTQIGKAATQAAFLAIAEFVEPHTVKHEGGVITVRNPTGGAFVIARSDDPDVRVQEQLASRLVNRVAIELKGGTDYSNVHNRAGEAEKSHAKARLAGYQECWTVIHTKGVDMARLRSESRTTDVWFDAAQVLGREGPDWDDFRRRLAAAISIPRT